jgi:hypothetical protein
MMAAMNYKVISSGSKGNCVIIHDVMIDCGLPFKAIKEDLYGIKYLLITHIHSDHLKLHTFDTIRKLFPRIKTIGNYEVHQIRPVDIVCNAGFEVNTKDYTFLPFLAIHDVLTYGYVWEVKGKRIIYCTDTATLENAPEGKYDYFFIESNHCEKKVELIRDEKKGNYSPYLSAKRHLSTQAAKAFYYMHRSSPEAELIELHRSLRFY